MIRQMEHGEENKIRTLLAKLIFEDQMFWRKHTKTLEDCLTESNRKPIGEEIKGRNIIIIAEEDGNLVGLCWCTIVDRGIDKQAEIAEFYVEKEYRGKGIGERLIEAAKQLFVNERVEVAFVWTHHRNEAAIELYKKAGFKKVDQLVMAFVPSDANKTI